jgi:hypothetical protein
MNLKRNNLYYLILTLLVLFALAACGGNQTDLVDEPNVPLELPEDIEPLILLAKFDLNIRVGIDVEKIETKSVEETEFPDPSLGVPQPGVDYPAEITPGYIIILEADGTLYEYRASAERVVQVPLENGQ